MTLEPDTKGRAENGDSGPVPRPERSGRSGKNETRVMTSLQADRLGATLNQTALLEGGGSDEQQPPAPVTPSGEILRHTAPSTCFRKSPTATAPDAAA